MRPALTTTSADETPFHQWTKFHIPLHRLRSEDAPPAPRHRAERGGVRRLQRHQHVRPRLQEKGHRREGVADRHRLDVRLHRQGRLVGGEGERLVRRRRERLVGNLLPQGGVEPVRVAFGRREQVDEEQMDPVLDQLTCLVEEGLERQQVFVEGPPNGGTPLVMGSSTPCFQGRIMRG